MAMWMYIRRLEYTNMTLRRIGQYDQKLYESKTPIYLTHHPLGP
jgi:hypothetical protein